MWSYHAYPYPVKSLHLCPFLLIGPLEILFDVIFFCDSEQYVDPSDSEFNVTCDVWANPPVDPNHLGWIPQVHFLLLGPLALLLWMITIRLFLVCLIVLTS